MMVGPLYEALNEAEALITGGLRAAALNLTEAECLRVDEAGVGSAGDLAAAEMGSGDGFWGVGEEQELSPAMDARGGKHKQVRCSST